MNDSNHPNPSGSLRLGIYVRGIRKEQLLALAELNDTQPGRMANRLLGEALERTWKGGDGK